MLFSFLNVDKKTELRIRLRKTKKQHITKKIHNLLRLERAKRFEEALSVEDVVAGVPRDCVDAVSNLDISGEVSSEE